VKNWPIEFPQTLSKTKLDDRPSRLKTAESRVGRRSGQLG
jgi:hypothetical protein